VYDFDKARNDKYTIAPYIAPEEIVIPASVHETVANQRARQRRKLLRVAAQLIDSDDIPTGGDSTESDALPKFDYPSPETKE
jgi:hypothetical protein